MPILLPIIDSITLNHFKMLKLVKFILVLLLLSIILNYLVGIYSFNKIILINVSLK